MTFIVLDARRSCFIYIHVLSRCASVNTPDPYNCQTQSTTSSDVTVGYILGPPAASSSPGVLGCPWRVAAAEGQRINLTLYDFGEGRLGVAPSLSPEDAEPEWDALDSAAAVAARRTISASSLCRRYAVVADVMARADIDICSSSVRFSHAYTSIGSSLEIRLLRKQVSSQLLMQDATVGGTFILRYEGKTTSITK